MDLTKENFEELANGDKPLIVDFWAPWCGPCRMVGPIVEELAEEFKDKAVVAKLNVDENNELASKFSVSSIPTIKLIKNGKEVESHLGAGSKESFQKMFEEWLKD
jgi:thioredoxin 1